MRILQLYEADNIGVVGSRVCPLHMAKTATVRKEVNGTCCLTATIPSGAAFENEIKTGRAIKATVNEAGDEQYFIVKKKTRNLRDGFTIYAEHQHYYYNGVIIRAGAENLGGYAQVVFNALRSYALPDITAISNWTYSRDANLTGNFAGRATPQKLGPLLKGWMIEAAGGELIFDGFNVEWVDQMGSDNGATYRYGANITGLETEDVIDDYCSGIYPFWGQYGDPNRPLTEIQNRFLEFSGSYPLRVIMPLDLTATFNQQPSQAELLAAAQEWASINAPTGVPLSIKAERARIQSNVPVDLVDTVTVTNTGWGLSQKTRVFALDFDAIKGIVERVELGTVNPGFAGAVKNMK